MSELLLGPEDADRTVEVAVGDRLVVALPETAGTGYTWTVEALPDGAEVLEERYEQPDDAAIGGSAHHVFVLAAAPGTLRLRHGQPWRGEDGVLARYTLTAVSASAG